MRRVQEYLKEVDSESLASAYLYEHPIYLQDVSDDTMTIDEAMRLVKSKLGQYIERLKTMEIEASKDKNEYVLFVHKVLEDGYEKETSSLVCVQELLESNENVETYAYEFTRQAEIMGFLVSDAELTQKNICSLLVDVLYESSFFGFEQQSLEDELRKLDEAIRDCEEGNTYTIDEFEKESGLVKEKVDEREKELRRRVWEASMEYDKYQKNKEIEALRNLLMSEKGLAEIFD